MSWFTKKYIHYATKIISKIDPSLQEDQIKEALEVIIKSNMKDPTIFMDNNVTQDNATITLSKLCGWIDKEKPVISGNATFYCQPEVLQSPTSNMLRTLKKERKAVKKKLFSYEPSSDEYASLDLEQNNKKVIMNADYGGSGAPTAAFYTKYSPPATTLMAQSIITTMAAFFEGYVGDNQKFYHLNECFDWMSSVIKKDENIPKWIVKPTASETAMRIKKHFIMPHIDDFPPIDDFINNCTEDELTYLYYANNIKDFIRNHPKVQGLLFNILSKLPNYEAAQDEVPDQFKGQFDSVNKYNQWLSKEMFLNPYSIPDCISDDMNEFMRLMTQFIHVEYITPDSIVKLNNHKRNTVLLVDTDSNMINADIFVSFVIDEIFKGDNFNRKKIYNEMILVNVLAAVLDISVKNILDYYGRCHNMNEDARSELTMKNEFMFRRFFLMLVKKRYVALIVLREGNIMIPFKPEIKGVDFIKAGVTEEVSNRFSKMLCDHILFPEELELHELMKDVKDFEKEIYYDLREGGTRYLKHQQYKDEGGYAKIKDKYGRVVGTKAWSLPVFRGASAWNALYKDKKINSLDRVCILKTTITGLSDLEKIKDRYPEDYQNIMRNIYNNPDEHIIKSGLKYLCIPSTGKHKIPDWVIDYIDYSMAVSDIIGSFRSVLDALKLENVVQKTPNGNASITSCLINL